MKKKKLRLKILSTNYRKGDTIKIISGNYKGKIGKIVSFEKNSNYVIIDSIVRFKKIFNKDLNKTEDTPIKTFIHISNIMGIDLTKNILSPIKKLRAENQFKRLFKKSNNIIENSFQYKNISKNKNE